jgi:hypothetical protein
MVMSMFGRQVEARVTSLAWRRTVVVEQGFWEFRRTSWKPHGDQVRNVQTLHSTDPDIVGGRQGYSTRPSPRVNPAHEVLAEHTYFEYEELVWRKHRSLTAKGDSPADLRWPEYELKPDQRIAERRETYRATFGAKDGDEFTADLDEETWRSLKRTGRVVRLKLSGLTHEVKHVEPA